MSPGRRFLLTGLLVAFAMVSPPRHLGRQIVLRSLQQHTDQHAYFCDGPATSQFAGQLSHLRSVHGPRLHAYRSGSAGPLHPKPARLRL